MKLFVERWQVTANWERLPGADRERWLSEISPAIEAMAARGVHYVCGASTLDDAAQPEFVAVWRVPDEETERAFRDAIAESGWYRYFRQTNLSGTELALEELIGSLVRH